MNHRSLESLRELIASNGPDAPNAMKELGSRYWNGTGLVKDEAEAHKWWLKASEAGNTPAMVTVLSAQSR